MEKITKNKNGQWDIEKSDLNLDSVIEDNKKGPANPPDFPSISNEAAEEAKKDKKIVKKPVNKLNKSEEEMEKGIKSTLATGLAGISMLAGNTARADMKSDLDNIANKQQATLSTPAAQAQSKKFVQDSAGAALKDMQSSHITPSKSNTSSVHYSPSDPATSKLFNQSLEAHLNDLGAVKTGGTWTHSEHNMGPLLEIAKQRAAGGHPSVGIVQKSLDEKLEQLEKALGDLKKVNPNTWVVTNSNGKNIETTSPAATGEAPHIKIGTTTTGKPVMSTHKDSYYKSFTPNEHREAFTIHGKLRQNLEGKHPSQMNTSLINHYKQMETFHDQGARIKD